VHLERIVDVNLNRLDESLKLIEDIIRFSFENTYLLAQVREIRNDFLKVKKVLPLNEIVAFRESQHDLGRGAKFDIATKKTSADLIIANLARAKESSRILEEILQSQAFGLSNKVKKIRFQIYDLEKGIYNLTQRKFSPRLYAIIDEKYLSAYRLTEMIDVLKNYGATMIQLRIKNLSDQEFYNCALKIRKAINKSAVHFIINNRIDIAQACHADGVHLGQDDIPTNVARKILGDSYIIGASARNIQEAKLAQNQGADYIGVGAIFKTKTKPDAQICKLTTLKRICQNVDKPVVGIGGITNKNYRAVLKAGADGIAVCSYLFEGDLRKNIRSLTPRKSWL